MLVAMPVTALANAARWASELNAFLHRGLADHLAQPEWDAERFHRGGEQLLALQNRCAMWGRSIISNCCQAGGTEPTPNQTQHKTKHNQTMGREG